ncbi:MAG TPA: hypothetical protein VH988_31615 [Thermoanaerobaculia bacterium]|jgi:hypothetical protein|nr:hypothetical protein [Thermoanaerobaculia bacterium]
MDHQTIDETHVVERYLLGQLSTQEAETFEDHYVDCAECLDRLELSRRLRQGLLQVATEEAVQAAVVQRLGLLARLARLGRSRQLGLALAAAAVLLLLPAGLLLREVRRLDGELIEARKQPSAEPGRQEAEAARKALAAERARAEQERTALQQKSEQLSAELEKARQPQVNTPIYPLSPERSGPGDGEPSNRIAAGPATGWVVLSLDLGAPETSNRTFHATLRRGPVTIWEGGGLHPDPQGSLVLSLPASLLSPGDYSVTVDAKNTAPAHFTFRVRPGR